jgi:hypothetical protein
MRKILVLAANPKDTPHLRLDEEVREIGDRLQQAKQRDQFDLDKRWAVRPRDVYQALLDFRPQIVHFSGHGTGVEGLVLEDIKGQTQLVSTEALARLFKLFKDLMGVECVLLNACYSEIQAEAVSQYIDYVIGMHETIRDEDAIEFVVAFYAALGAGESYKFAYQLGCNEDASGGWGRIGKLARIEKNTKRRTEPARLYK